MVARKPGRFLAPVALIVVLVAVILIVRARTDSHHAPPPAPTTPARVLPASHPATSREVFYVVKPSDTLSEISVKTGVPVATLEALNPSIDLSALQIGQRIRLRH